MKQPVALSAGSDALSPPAPLAEAKKSAGQMRPQLATASLYLHDPAEAAGGPPGARRSILKFQFNPKELSIQKSAKWERKTAKGAKKAGPPEFNGSEPCKLTMELFFDASGKQDTSVVEAVERLFECCLPTDESRDNNKPTPPLVVLHWGSVVSFPAFVTQVSAKYTRFSLQGTPIRATCNLSLEEMPGDPKKQNPTSGGLSARRAHTITAGDSLASLAFAEYGDPGMWRALARYNEIDDPMRLRPGSALLIPSIDDLFARVG
ncbi:LysM peptidoglycan-binding domain-containing protein [Angustibacter sp. McL0619]|uniref:CIS tube protein n=1 Tax=Angustibacter sp. McL0619 TaxID=3415676 RepID=UPI003CEC9758